jgi:hypothetical protein
MPRIGTSWTSVVPFDPSSAGSEGNRVIRRMHIDRHAQDPPFNAEVAPVEIDDPLVLEPGDKIVALRSTRGDLLAKLHTHRQIDEAQFRGGRAFQADWGRAERGLVRSIRRASASMAARRASRLQKHRGGRSCGSTG